MGSEMCIRDSADVVLVGEALVRHGAPEEALRAFRAASLTVR